MITIDSWETISRSIRCQIIMGDFSLDLDQKNGQRRRRIQHKLEKAQITLRRKCEEKYKTFNHELLLIFANIFDPLLILWVKYSIAVNKNSNIVYNLSFHQQFLPGLSSDAKL